MAVRIIPLAELAVQDVHLVIRIQGLSEDPPDIRAVPLVLHLDPAPSLEDSRLSCRGIAVPVSNQQRIPLPRLPVEDLRENVRHAGRDPPFAIVRSVMEAHVEGGGKDVPQPFDHFIRRKGSRDHELPEELPLPGKKRALLPEDMFPSCLSLREDLRAHRHHLLAGEVVCRSPKLCGIVPSHL